ncbi:MAG: phosphate--acyl-ACP acyltransferase, partial [Candidatus Omnitrophica bacterium]|nr:phosphate--acyl-ACP acyltransferase [Candidatus Omnitrophota bacterium]
MKIIVDAMGGDYAPEVVIEGSILAVNEYDTHVVLVGDEARIKALLKSGKYAGDRISIYPSQEVIEMSESAATSVRRKRNSSIVVGLNLVKEGFGDAFFSAGNTGAVV